METAFTNELGNQITIRVTEGAPIGVAKQLVVTMIGPDSVMENTITEMEAEMLVRALVDYQNTKRTL